MTGKREKPLSLDKPFAEALIRFIGTDPTELPDSSKLKQKKRGPPRRPPKPKGASADNSGGG